MNKFKFLIPGQFCALPTYNRCLWKTNLPIFKGHEKLVERVIAIGLVAFMTAVALYCVYKMVSKCWKRRESQQGLPMFNVPKRGTIS